MNEVVVSGDPITPAVIGVVVIGIPVFMYLVFKIGNFFAMRSVSSFNKEAKSNPNPLSKEQLEAELFGLNNEQAPFTVVKEGEKIIVRWKILDASWYEFFKKAKFERYYELQILLTNKRVARVIETNYELKVKGGVGFSLGGRISRGWSFVNMSFSKAYGIKSLSPLEVGKIYDVTFSSTGTRGPILKFIAERGWTIQPTTVSLKWGI
jgi:hypothetical protein